MKPFRNLFSLLIPLLFSFCAAAQGTGDLEIFSKKGERFYVILNGQQMHQNAETNVELQDLPSERYKLKVIFEDSTIGTLDKNIIVKDGQKFTYIIRKNLFDNYAIKPYSKSATASNGNQGKDSGTGEGDTQGKSGKASSKGQKDQGMQGPPSEGISISVDINSSDNSFNTTIETETSTHHQSHTHTKSESSSDVDMEMKEDEEKESAKEEEPEEEGPLPDYNGPTGCQDVMSDSRFREAKSSIQNKSFADSKMTQAKRMTKNNCLLTDQVQELIGLFNFEDDRLEYAKFAHDHTYDQGNYYKIHDSFEFSSTIDELDQYLENK